MRKILHIIVCATIVLFNSYTTQAQVKDEPIEIKTFSTEIKAGQFTAVTTLLIEFYNPNNKILDGEYNFALNAGQVITGFALDINGFMRDGVITDKQQGRVAYENTIRRRIDPGLLEMTTGDNYRIRVYPMPAKGTRKLKIIIAEQLAIKNNALNYSLPLDVSYMVKNFEISININQARQTPLSNDGLIKNISFFKSGNNHTLTYSEKNIELKKPVSFSIPLLAESKTVCSFSNSSGAFFAARIKPGIPVTAAPPVSSAVIFWDVSGSASKRNIKKELALLDNYCEEKNISRVTVVTFSNTIHETVKFNLNKGINNTLRVFLETKQYDGGTRLGSLDCKNYEADQFLLFSDGISNYGDPEVKINSKPVNCITSAPAANHTLLKQLSNRTGGRYINLNTLDVKEAIAMFSRTENKLIETTSTGNSKLNINSVFPVSFDEWITISGQANGNIPWAKLLFGDMGSVSKTETILFEQNDVCDSAEINLLGMLQQYAALQEQGNENAVQLFATTSKLVSKFTSFIVLDNLEDYIEYGIEPPADLLPAYIKRMGEITKNKEEQKNNAANAIVNNLLNTARQYNERIGWWSKDETPLKTENILVKDNERKIKIQLAAASPVENPGNADALRNFKTENFLSEVVVVGYGTMARRNLTGSIATVRSSEISSAGAISIGQALAGRVPGLQVISNPNPGVAEKIFIRGMSSFSGGEPLYIIDGFPGDADLAGTIAISNIESITVLKGIEASMLYGSRAAHGAIVITSKRFTNNRSTNNVIRYKSLEDVDYVLDLKSAGKDEMYQRYFELKDTLSEEPSFYFDAAELIFKTGDKEKAIRILTNLLEMDNENHQLLRAVGYMFENWKMYKEATEIYSKVLEIKEEEPQSYRDLALAYEKTGDPQAAVDILYTVITKNWAQYENRYRGLRSLLLTEMNTIIGRHRNKLDLSGINEAVIKSLPVDLRIVVDWNKDETDIDLHIVEPGGEVCFYGMRNSKAGGRMAEDFTQGYGPEEYQIRNAKKGKYAIHVNYYGDRYQKKQIPSFIKLTIFRNYGRPDQSVTTETFIMDNQSGKVEIGEVKWQ